MAFPAELCLEAPSALLGRAEDDHVLVSSQLKVFQGRWPRPCSYKWLEANELCPLPRVDIGNRFQRRMHASLERSECFC